MLLKKEMFSAMLRDLPSERKCVAESLIETLIFMQHTLTDLSEKIEAEVTIISHMNGNKVETMTENPALKSYNNTIRNFSTTCRTLTQYLPKESEEEDELMQFLKGRIKQRGNSEETV